ncbi:MAG: hypothetical protein ABIZ34_00300 [Candidatus Limnocylindrales bacterium]
MATTRTGLRLLAVLLLALWIGLAIAIALAYRPGGPFDLGPALATLIPALVVAAAVRWPLEVAADSQLGRGAIWLGLTAALLVAPLLLVAAETVVRGRDLPVVPSLEIGYAGILAALATCVFGCLGILRRRAAATATTRRYVANTVALGTALTVVGTLSFAGAAIVTAGALRLEPPGSSDYGPTDPTLEPPHCDVPPLLGPGADVLIAAKAIADGQPIGTATATGSRSGRDESWTASATGEFTSGTMAYSRTAALALVAIDGQPPGSRDALTFGLASADGTTLDPPVWATLRAGETPAANEELGLDVFEGASARHCRVAIDGTTALDTFFIARWIAAKDPFTHTTALSVWRGEIDWWVFADGQLGRVRLLIGGYPGDAWPVSKISGIIEVDMDILRRDRPHDIATIAPGQ